MKIRVSTSMTLVILFALLAALSQWVAYRMSSDVLSVTVREREIDKIKTVSRVVEGLIAQQAARVGQVAGLLATLDALPAALDLPEADRTAALSAILGRAYKSSRVDLLEVTDEREVVVYRAHAPHSSGDTADAWGIAEALAGNAMVVSSSGPQGVAVRAIEPLRAGERIVGTLSAGLWLNESLLKALSLEVGTELALLSRSGQTVAASAALAGSIDAKAVTEAFHQKIPIYREDAIARQTRVYLPTLIIDEAFVVLAQINSASAYQLLEQSSRRSAGYAALILAASLVFGLAALRYVLGPLRRLRARAEQTAIDLTGQAITAEDRDEVRSVVHVLETLTGRLVERNRELADAKAAADAASAAKSQFLSSMSHEIRTPLNGVLGMAELLQQTPLNAEQAHYAHAIGAAGRSLHDLLGDILDLAKIEAGKVPIERVDFEAAPLAADVGEGYRQLAATRGIAFSTAFDPAAALRVSGDPTRLRQVLSNLLGNAVKFTERGTITFSSERLDDRSGDDRRWLRFTVSDTGIGIAPEVIGKLFKPFVQADASTTRKFGGTGLGLVICKHLVELMGGEIHVDSAPGQGARFWVDIPFGPPAAPASDTAAPRTATAQIAAQVLIAEDNVVNQQVVRAMLARLGATATVVENGAAAVAALQCGRFDIVLMDCQMPVMDGYQATTQIRAMEGPQRHTPIIALTANALAEDRQRCVAAGMDDYLAKPVSLAALRDALLRWLPAAARHP